MLFQMIGADRIFPKLFPGHFLTDWDHDNTRCVDQVMGAFFMVRRSLFEKLEGFDECFFVYYEDLDFSLRAKQKGYSTWFLADAAAYHRGCGTSDAVKKERLFYYLKSRILYGFKHFDRKQGFLLLLGTLILEPVSRVTLALLHFSGGDVADTIRAFRMLIVNLLANDSVTSSGHE
jgi:GT2 family glycosyltransferase